MNEMLTHFVVDCVVVCLIFHFWIVDISLFDAMGVFESFNISLWCQSNRHCLELARKHMSSGKETASFALGLVSVVIWVVAEIPQIITNYRAKSTDGLSATFLITWIIG
jgi:hypothetical protein